ncbi:MAG: FtsX-like permease family protein, partial [Bifidobacteriaceae bacterium]|nr:FtsX-like permease family protein [Bifidobacteriaceae bacterium]
VSQTELAAAIAPILPVGSAVSTGQQIRQAAKDSINQMLGFVTTFLLAFALIALFVASFLIANTFAMITRQRIADTAVLRALGASRRQIFGWFVGQAALVGVVGSALGLLTGFGLLSLIRRILSTIGMSLSASVPITGWTLALPVVLGLVVTCLAAGLPARRAAKVPPVEALREALSVRDKPLKTRNLIGLVGLTIAVASLVVSALSQDDSLATLCLAAGALLLLISALMLSPWLTRPMVNWLGWLPAKLFKPLGQLARRNLTRHLRRTANTTAALLVGTALVATTLVMTASANASVEQVIGNELRADLMIQDAGNALPVPTKMLEQVAKLPDVTVITINLLNNCGLPEIDQTGTNNYYFGMLNEPTDISQAMNVKMVDGSLTGASDAVIVHEDFAKANELKVGDFITVALFADTPYRATLTAPVGAIISAAAYSVPVTLPRSLLERHVDQAAFSLIQTVQAAVLVQPGGNIAATEQALTKLAEPYHSIAIYSQDDFASIITDQVNQQMTIVYGLLALSLIIAVLGIVNTLTMSVLERRREIGLMRAVGLGRSQLKHMLLVEGFLVALFGTLCGLLLGTAIAALLPHALADYGLGTLVVPWGSLALLLVGAALVGMLAALWPARRAARLPVLQAVAYE